MSTIVAVARLRLLSSPPSLQVRWSSMPSLSHVAVAVAAAVLAVILVMLIVSKVSEVSRIFAVFRSTLLLSAPSPQVRRSPILLLPHVAVVAAVAVHRRSLGRGRGRNSSCSRSRSRSRDRRRRGSCCRGHIHSRVTHAAPSVPPCLPSERASSSRGRGRALTT